MRNQLTVLLALLMIQSCSTNTADNTQDSKTNVDTLSGIEHEVNLYEPVRPEINDIRILNELLSKADSVVAYNYNGYNGNAANVEFVDLFDVTTQQLCPSATNGKILSKRQIDTLIEITSDTTTYDGSWSSVHGTCFIPHLGFGFFNRDSLIAQINVCFLCEAIRTRPYYCSDGLSLKGYQRLYNFTKKIGMKIIDHSSGLEH